jgi:sporulation protein YlmC with PRC-barrel domain
MKRTTVTQFILWACCGLALTAGAAAQQPASAPIAGVATLGVAVAQADLIATGWRASKLLHADVYNDKNEKIGTISDLIVAPDGTLSVAVIDVGGFLGLGTHRVAIPVQQFKHISPPRLTLPGATKEALKRLPEFQYTS